MTSPDVAGNTGIMRTTITLDDDVARKLRTELRRRRGATFKDVVNDTLRTGLLTRRELEVARPFKVDARRMGVMPGINYDSIAETIDRIEGAQHK